MVKNWIFYERKHPDYCKFMIGTPTIMGLSLANIYELKRLQENNKIKVHFISEGTPPSKSSADEDTLKLGN